MLKEEIEKALLEANGDLRLAASILNVAYNKLYYNVNKFKLKFVSNKPIIDVSKIEELYNKHQSLSLVAKELNCTKEGIRLVMQRNGIKINEQIRYSFDEDFFKGESEEVFYWAGFIAADGCLLRRNEKESYLLSIGLAIKDKYHLEFF